MRNKIIAAMLAAALVFAFVAGCSRKPADTETEPPLNGDMTPPEDNMPPAGTPDTTPDTPSDMNNGLSFEGIMGTLGRPDTELETLFGTGSVVNGMHRFENDMFDGSATFDVDVNEGKNVNKIVITTDKAHSEKWIGESTNYYGTAGENNMWENDKSKMVVEEIGDQIKITITEATK